LHYDFRVVLFTTHHVPRIKHHHKLLNVNWGLKTGISKPVPDYFHLIVHNRFGGTL